MARIAKSEAARKIAEDATGIAVDEGEGGEEGILHEVIVVGGDDDGGVGGDHGEGVGEADHGDGADDDEGKLIMC